MPRLNEQMMITLATTKLTASAQQNAPAPNAGAHFGTPGGPRIGQHRAVPQPTVDFAAKVAPVCKAICNAHDQWRTTAGFHDISINAPVASGGRLDGSDLEGLINQSLLGVSLTNDTYATAVAKAIGEAWWEFQQSVSVPGLPWYPMFVAVATATAPPTPNVATPFATLNFDRSCFRASNLAERMGRALRTPDAKATPFFEAICHAFETVIDQWLSAQSVTNVMGTGPVPSFAPPHLPVGPVSGGHTLPGVHLMS